MGKPKFSRKKYVTPSHPWQEDRIKKENEFLKKYGLKNKREVWKAETRLRKYRGQARELLAKIDTGDAQSKKESNQLLIYLSKMNILPPKSTLDDVLTLNIESILSRRLQTLTYLKGLANTPDQSRQLISHGHITIGNRRVTVPGYLVTKDEEGEIGYTSDSPLNDTMHPARPKADFKSIPIKREEISGEPESKKEGQPTEKKSKESSVTEPSKNVPEKPAEGPKEKEAHSEKPDETQTEKKPDSTDKVKKEPTAEQPSVEQTPKPPVEKPQKEDPIKTPAKEPKTPSKPPVKESPKKKPSTEPEEKPIKEPKKEEKPKKEKEEDKGGK
jgi:small subunit ribosomal protein S4